MTLQQVDDAESDATGHLDIGYRQRNRETDNWTYRTGLGRPIKLRVFCTGAVAVYYKCHIFYIEFNCSAICFDHRGGQGGQLKSYFYCKFYYFLFWLFALTCVQFMEKLKI